MTTLVLQDDLFAWQTRQTRGNPGKSNAEKFVAACQQGFAQTDSHPRRGRSFKGRKLQKAANLAPEHGMRYVSSRQNPVLLAAVKSWLKKLGTFHTKVDELYRGADGSIAVLATGVCWATKKAVPNAQHKMQAFVLPDEFIPAT